MKSLPDLYLRTSYHKGRDDIARDFYLPCMRSAVRYDRAVGYFRSTVFAVAWPALAQFVEQGGKMRILCSHVLAGPDADALYDGYDARLNEKIAQHYLQEVKGLLAEPELQEPVRVLAALVAAGVIEFRIAILTSEQRRGVKGRLFHDKLGIFEDAHGNKVVFDGSANETWHGLAADGNLEAIRVSVSWEDGREPERVAEETAYFAAMWNNTWPGLTVRPLPKVAREELERVASSDWQAELDECLKGSRSVDPFGRTLRSHQAQGLASWRANNRRGILAFATGAGKTFTAIQAIIESLVDHHERVLVVVPDQVMLRQWYYELVETTQSIGATVLRAGAGYTRWKKVLRGSLEQGEGRQIVVATIQTAATTEFLNQVPVGDNTLIVIDEVHRAGSPHHQAVLDPARFAGPRLGLSATPERAGDPVGTAAILDFFETILEPRYTLADAVRDNVLCRYFYRPHTVKLTQQEEDDWAEMSKRIGQLVARQKQGSGDGRLADRIKLALIQRARIVKQAEAKINLAVQVLSEAEDDSRWLVYCDNLNQLRQVSAALESEGIIAMPFHSKMDGDREATLGWLNEEGGIVVAIKCLDEGVDVPSVSHALILASSKNPREYIQRRGRVLRRSDRKTMAFIHDAIVVPSRGETDDDAPPDPITVGELSRAIEFAENADNPSAAADLHEIAIDMGIDWRALTGVGIESEDEDDDED